MIITETDVRGAYLIEIEKHGDERGFFARVFCSREFAELGLVTDIVQVGNSSTAGKGTLRGMHYQLAPARETKMVRCVRGALYDVCLDLREDSETFGKSCGVELTADNRRMFYIPKGCAHGFLSLEDDTEVFYFMDEYYTPERERGVRWNDPHFGIDWPGEPVVISEKDASHPDFDPVHHLGRE